MLAFFQVDYIPLEDEIPCIGCNEMMPEGITVARVTRCSGGYDVSSRPDFFQRGDTVFSFIAMPSPLCSNHTRTRTRARARRRATTTTTTTTTATTLSHSFFSLFFFLVSRLSCSPSVFFCVCFLLSRCYFSTPADFVTVVRVVLSPFLI